MDLPILLKHEYVYPEKFGEVYYFQTTPIQTLHVSNLPYKLNMKTLGNYFSKYGEIDSIIIRNGEATYKFKMCIRYAFITFKSAKAAARSFDDKTHHIIKNKNVKIQIAEIWHQPKYKKQKHTELEPENASHPKITILDLNDDCLLHILSYLKIYDQFAFSCTSARFRSACEVVFERNESFILDDHARLRHKETCKLLSAISPYLKEVTILIYRNEFKSYKIVKKIWKNCKKFEALNLYNFNFQSKLSKLKSLKALSLINCHISDETMQNLLNLIGINSVKLVGRVEQTRQYLNKMSNLKKLDISDTDINSSCLISIAKNTTLKELYIERIDFPKRQDIEELFTNLTDLEFLSISQSNANEHSQNYFETELIKLKNLKYLKVLADVQVIFHDIRKLENLEYLEIFNGIFNQSFKMSLLMLKKLTCFKIDGGTGIDDPFIDELATAVPLRSLGLINVNMITQDGIIKFITKCPSIEEIDISHGSDRFDNAFILRIIDVMLQIKRTKPLKLIVGSTAITESIENEEKFARNEGLLKLCFHVTVINQIDYISESPSPNYLYEIATAYYSEQDESDDSDNSRYFGHYYYNGD